MNQHTAKSFMPLRYVCKTFTCLDAFLRFSLPYLFEVNYDATLLHHGVLLVVIHQVSQGVEPLPAAHVIFTILLETNINSSTTATAGLRSSSSAKMNHELLKNT